MTVEAVETVAVETVETVAVAVETVPVQTVETKLNVRLDGMDWLSYTTVTPPPPVTSLRSDLSLLFVA